MMTFAQRTVWPDTNRLECVGELRSADVSRIHDEALEAGWAGQTVVLDLTRVTKWSVVAQAMIVGLARDLAARGSRLVLTGASLGLRLQCQRMDVFNKVRRLSD